MSKRNPDAPDPMPSRAVVADWVGGADEDEIYDLQRYVTAATNLARARAHLDVARDEFLDPGEPF